MAQDDKPRRLGRMLRQVVHDPSALESLARPRGGALESLGMAEPELAAAERSALEKLSRGRDAELTPLESFAVEAIVLPKERPVALVRDGEFENVAAPWEHLNTAEMRARLKPLIRSVGRIEVPFIPALPYAGTGFVVGRNLLMTNRHVAVLFANGVGTQIQYHPGSAVVDFRREAGSTAASVPITVTGVPMVHPFWDMALLRVEGLDGFQPLPLSTVAPEELEGQEVAVVGYPARDDRNDLDVQDRVFQKQYNVKRFQPGRARVREMIRSFENQVNAMTHDSSTLGGNSGSAVIHLATGKVIGLHFAGIYLKANYAVPTFELARDERVVQLGVNFDGTVASSVTDRPAPRMPDSPAEARTKPVFRIDGGGVSFSVPLHVRLSLGSPPDGAPAAAAPAPTEGLKIPIIHGGLASRKGYRPDFLGLDDDEEVPLPSLTAAGRAAVATTITTGDHEIRYHKFSVVQHRERRLALFTAANVDWRPSKRMINGKKPTRAQLTGLKKGDIEQWVTDSRLRDEDQLPDAFYTKDGKAFDKGHLVRRDDVAWGKTFNDIQKANGDTYHTTNCSPQVLDFNQASKGEDNWGDLEDLVEEQTSAERAAVFSGPVFDDDDQVFEGVDGKGGQILLKIPRQFWKIIVVREGNSAGAYGFMLEQDLSGVPMVEFIVTPPWQQYLTPIADIEDALGGLVDLSWFKDHDRAGSQEGRAISAALATTPADVEG